MRVCKHGCDVKVFRSSHANHTMINLKKCLRWKRDNFTLFTHSLVGWNLENLYKHAVSIVFSLTVKPGQAYPPSSRQWIYYSKVESVGSCRFQIQLCVLACVMSCAFTCKAVTKFLPIHFPWIWCKCLLTKISIQRFSIWPDTEKFSLDIHCSLHMQKCWFEFDKRYENH